MPSFLSREDFPGGGIQRQTCRLLSTLLHASARSSLPPPSGGGKRLPVLPFFLSALQRGFSKRLQPSLSIVLPGSGVKTRPSPSGASWLRYQAAGTDKVGRASRLPTSPGRGSESAWRDPVATWIRGLRMAGETPALLYRRLLMMEPSRASRSGVKMRPLRLQESIGFCLRRHRKPSLAGPSSPLFRLTPVSAVQIPETETPVVRPAAVVRLGRLSKTMLQPIQQGRYTKRENRNIAARTENDHAARDRWWSQRKNKSAISAVRIWIRIAFSLVPTNVLIFRCCLIVLKKSSISQRSL